MAQPRSQGVRRSRLALVGVCAALAVPLAGVLPALAQDAPPRPDRPDAIGTEPEAPPTAPTSPNGPDDPDAPEAPEAPGAPDDSGASQTPDDSATPDAADPDVAPAAPTPPQAPDRPVGPTDRAERPDRPHRTPTCGCPTVTVVKEVVEALTGAVGRGAGFTFSITKVVPEPVDTFPFAEDNRPTAVTDSNGTIVFGAISAKRSHTLTIVEHQRDGYELVQQDGHNAVCTDDDTGASKTSSNTTDGFVIDLPHNGDYTCVVRNQTTDNPPSELESAALIVRAELEAADGSTTPMSGVDYSVERAAGEGTLAQGLLTTQPDGSTFTEVIDLAAAFSAAALGAPPGGALVEVIEAVPAGYDLTGISCDADHEPSDPAVSVAVAPSSTVTCVFTHAVPAKAPAPATVAGLPFTGGDAGRLLGVGLVALTAGIGLYCTVRRRRASA